MRHGTSNANGHGMPCDEGFPISAASKDTVGRIPPTCQHLMLRVSSEEGSSLFCTLLFPKNLDRSKLWSFSYLDFRYPNLCAKGAGTTAAVEYHDFVSEGATIASIGWRRRHPLPTFSCQA